MLHSGRVVADACIPINNALDSNPGDSNMMKMILLAGVAIATSLTFSADHADAFGGRGYARRQARRAYYAPTPVVVQRVYAPPVVSYYSPPVVSYSPAAVYYQPPVSVNVGRYDSYYGSGYYRSSYPTYGGGVSIGIGW